MENVLREKIENFSSIIICGVEIQEDILSSPFSVYAGSFEKLNLASIKNLQGVINAINPHGEVCEGMGYKEYCSHIKREISSCIKDKDAATLIIPLLNEKKENVNLLLFLKRTNEELECLFMVLDANLEMFSTIDKLIANSFKDKLTGLFNFNTLAMHVEGNRRNGYLCFFDLNGFKAINDNYGHKVGDDVLLQISSYLISISSSNEIFYRRSGDEFMILVFRNDIKYVYDLIDKILSYLKEMPEKLFKQYKNMRCSAAFGVLELNYDHQDDIIDFETITKLTDLAMYQAKYSHKKSHLITYDDAKGILKQSNLDERLKEIAATIQR